MTKQLKERIAKEWAMLDPVDPLRGLLSDVIAALAQPERHELQAKGEHPAPCARFCEANAFRIVERGYQRQIRELQASLAQDEQSSSQEPVEDVVAYHSDGTRTVRITPKRPWVGLTNEEKHEIRYSHMTSAEFIEFIEAALRSKNT